MKNILPILAKCPLFAGICEKDMEPLLGCLNARPLEAKKGEIIFAMGEQPNYVGIVLAGGVHIVQEDYWGRRTILAAKQTGELFGESFSCAEVAGLPVSVLAHQDSLVLLVDCKRILSTCSSSCVFHAGLIRNLAKVLAGNNIRLTQKMEHITKKNTKEKVLSYLSECAVSAGTNRFSIPFNRQELADYLSVERSALSNTLSTIRKQGLIEFDKNHFVLH